MTQPSLNDLRAQLDAIDACLRKYVRLRAQLIEIITFMEDEKEQEHLKLIRERSRTASPMHDIEPNTAAPEPARAFQGPFRPKPSGSGTDEKPSIRPNPFATTLSMEA